MSYQESLPSVLRRRSILGDRGEGGGLVGGEESDEDKYIHACVEVQPAHIRGSLSVQSLQSCLGQICLLCFLHVHFLVVARADSRRARKVEPLAGRDFHAKRLSALSWSAQSAQVSS